MKTAALRPLKSFSFDTPMRSVAFFPDGKRIAAAGHLDGSAHIWNFQTGKQEGVPLKGHSRPVIKLVVSEDGRKLITGGQDHNIFLWNTRDKQKPLSKQLFGGFGSGQTDFLTFNVMKNIPRLIASASSTSIKIWEMKPDSKEVTQINQIPVHATTVNSVSLSTASLNLMAAAWGKKAVKIFDTRSGEQCTELNGYAGSIRCLAWFPDSKQIISTANSTIYIADGRKNEWTTRKLEGHLKSIQTIDVHPGGRFVASGGEDKVLRVWDTQTGAQVGSSTQEMGAITSIAFSPDGKLVLSVSRKRHALLWDAAQLGVKPRDEGPLQKFFSKYPQFDYDPKKVSTSEFIRMCSHFRWKEGSDDKKQAKKAFRKALTEQFNVTYGTDVDDLKSWQKLCVGMGVYPIPNSTKKCRELFCTTHVNLVDLVHSGKNIVKIFATSEELSDYTLKTKKIFPREEAYAGGLLKYLLRHIMNPELDRDHKFRNLRNRPRGKRPA